MAFNINAQVILSGPKNIKAVTNTIKQQLGNINVNVGVNVPKNASQQVKGLQTQMSALNTTTKRLNAQSATTGKQMKNVAQNTKQAANAMQVLGKETALTFKRFAAAGIVTATFFRLTNAISEAVPKALEFERELVKIQQTTGGTINQLNGLRKTADELAKSLGLDANEIISVGRVFAQTGQTLDQVESSLRAVARASLAPSFGEMENTAEGLIAALAQFNIQASQSEAVLASINAVSKQFAVESQDIIGAIRRTGGVFAIAATDAEKPVDALNQLIAIFTSVRSTTRESAETIATGLRTIFSRIQRPQTIEFLKSLNINLTDAEGNFVGLFSAFRILSTELDGIIARGDTLALSRIVEELGGIRQVGKLIPAIREFRKAENAFAVAAEGAAQGLGQDVATGLTPLIKTFEQIQARFDSLVRAITESATFEAFAKTVAGLANAFLGLAEALVPVLPAITTLATLKIAGGISDFAKGFLGSGRAGGGIAGAGAALGGAVTGGAGVAQAAASSAAASATTANTQALASNTTAITSATTSLGNVDSAVSTLNQTVVNLDATIDRLIPVMQASSARSALGVGVGGRRGGARPPRGFNRGGFVPGTGNSDTVPAMLTPGEFVIKKSAVQAFGAGNLNKINKYQGGTQGRGVPDEPQRAIITTTSDLPAIFLNQGDGPKALGSVPINKQNLTNSKGPVRDIAKSLFPKELSGFGDSDVIEARLGTFRSLIDSTASEDLIKEVRRVVGNSIEDISTSLIQSFEIDGLIDADQETAVQRALGEIDFNSIAGHFFEGIVSGATGAKLTESGATFDFADLTPEIVDRLNKLFDPQLPIDSAILEAKKGLTKDNISSNASGSLLRKILASYEQGNPFGLSIKKFASGGMASGTDTVPALLTPGEFVVNKSSAQAFGYGNLNKINKYADGGIVQEFANGSTGRGVRVAGGGRSKAVSIDTKQVSGAFNDAAKAADASTDANLGLASVFSGLSGQALILSSILPNLSSTLSNFDGSVTGTLSGLANVAIIGSSLIPVIGAIKRTLAPLKGFETRLRSGAELQRRINNSIAKGIAVPTPGVRGSLSRKEAAFRVQKGGAASRVGAAFEAGGLKSAGRQFGTEVSRTFIKTSRSLGNRVGGDIGRSVATNTSKFLVKNAGTIGIGIGLVAAELITESVVDSLLGAKEVLAGGRIEGRTNASTEAIALGGAVTGGVSGAVTGAGLALLLAPLTGGFSALIPIVGGFVGALTGATSALEKQTEFLNFKKLQQSSEAAAAALDKFEKSGRTGAAATEALASQDVFFKQFEKQVGLSGAIAGGQDLVSEDAGRAAGAGVGAAVGAGIGGFFTFGAAAGIGAGIGATIGAAIGDFFAGEDIDEQLEGLKTAIQGVSEEQLKKQLQLQESVRDSIFQSSAAVLGNVDAFTKLKDSGLKAVAGAGEITGSTAEYVAALKEIGDVTGQGEEAVTAYKQAVRTSALEQIKSGEASKAFGKTFLTLEKTVGTGEASIEDINAALEASGIESEEAKAKVIARVQALQLEQQANGKSAASAIAAAEVMNKLSREIEALGEALNKLNSISSGAVSRFDAFVSNFEADFDRAFSSDARLTLPARFDPFANLDASTSSEIADGLERIRNAVGDPEGTGATAGFESILSATKELPFALKAGLDELLSDPETRNFASAQDLTSAVLGQLAKRGAEPQGAARDLLVRNLEQLFTSRQGTEGGPVALEADLVEGIVAKLNEGGEAVKQALSDLTQTLNEYQSAQLRAAQVTIEIANKRREFELKELDIRQRGRDFLGLDRNRDPRAVAEERLANRLTTIQTNVAGVTAGGVGLQAETGVDGLTANLKLLEDEIGPLRAAVEAGTANPEEIKRLAALETALGETKQSLDTLADDTSRLSAIQDRLAQIESRKQTAQEQVLDFNRRRSEAVRSGNFEELARLDEEFRRPLDALRKVRAGEGLTDVEAADLEGGLGLLEGGGFIGPDEARKIRNALTAGIVDSDFFRNVFAGFTIGPNALPVEDFVGTPESFGGGAFVGEVTPEEARLRDEGEELIDERVDAAQARFKTAQDQLIKARNGELSKIIQLELETRKAEQAFLDAGGALGVLRGEAVRLPAAVGQPPVARPAAGAGAAIGPQGGAPVADVNDGGLALIATTIPNNTTEMTLLRTEIQLLKDQISQGLNVNLNGNQNINIGNLATAGNEFQQITELTTARAFAEKTPELEQQFGQTMTSQLNTA